MHTTPRGKIRFRPKSKGAKIALLRSVPLFSACTNRELGRIAAIVEEIDAEAGKVLVREGDSGRECFVVAEGTARATSGGRKVAAFDAGSIFGEMSLLDGGPRSCTVTAETDMHLLVMNGRGFAAVVEDLPPVAHKVMRAMAERLRAAERRSVTH